MTAEEQQKARQGVLLALGAYTMWGIAPIYFKSLAAVSPLEILSHRVVWSFSCSPPCSILAVIGAPCATF